jgi:hypothetical protein
MFETGRKMLGLVHSGFDREALITHPVLANDFEGGFLARPRPLIRARMAIAAKVSRLRKHRGTRGI